MPWSSHAHDHHYHVHTELQALAKFHFPIAPDLHKLSYLSIETWEHIRHKRELRRTITHCVGDLGMLELRASWTVWWNLAAGTVVDGRDRGKNLATVVSRTKKLVMSQQQVQSVLENIATAASLLSMNRACTLVILKYANQKTRQYVQDDREKHTNNIALEAAHAAASGSSRLLAGGRGAGVCR